MKSKVVSLAALAAFGVASAVSAPASAFVQESSKTVAESMGNNNAYAGFSANSSQGNVSGTVGVTLPNGFASVPFMRSTASQSISTSVKVFSVSAKPIAATLNAQGYWQAGTDGGTGTYTQTAKAKLMVLGSTAYSNSGVDCGTASSPKKCAAASKTWEKDIAKGQASFTFFGFPITIHGRLWGTVGAGFDASATASKYLGLGNSLMSRTNASWGAFAGVSGHIGACAGFCDVLGVDLDVPFTLIDVNVGPKAAGALGATLTGDARYSYENTAGINLTTLKVKAILKVNYLISSESVDLVSWDGYSDSWSLWNHKGQITCEDWRSRPSSDCRDYIN